MRGDEARVVRVMRAYLEGDGWRVSESRASRNEPDIIALRGDETLIAEAKGRTQAARTDVDTMWGQMLRRVSEHPGARFAAVVPTEFVSRTLEVTPDVRAKLGITVFEVTDDDRVIEHG